MKILMVAILTVFGFILMTSEMNGVTAEETAVVCTETCGGLTLTEEEWRERLSPEAFRILREHGTERLASIPWRLCFRNRTLFNEV